mmetsp:Transcript_19239/g.44701  ORF Transcript_19239/g.44701 Transcript_19239/m.44701 type:complete len:85 (-) Transcript_19239:199-453(-)
MTQLNRGGPGPVTGNGVSAVSESHRFAPGDEPRGPIAATQKLRCWSRKEVKEWKKGQWRKKAVILKISLIEGPTDGEFVVKWLL